jgi:hypothetical protein
MKSKSISIAAVAMAVLVPLNTRLCQLLPNLQKTPYAEGIRATIDAMRTRAVPARV